jgi:hypothetical protein
MTVPNPQVAVVQVPGLPGPPTNITIGTVVTAPPDDPATATMSGIAPNQILDLVLPRGDTGIQGPEGPANTLTIGTVTSDVSASATITGSAPNQTLNLVLPAGPTGDAGPVNTLSIGTVDGLDAGQAPTATITGSAPSQILNLGIPAGETGPANTLDIGTVTTLAAGASATATITGAAPTQTLNLGIPQGAAGSGAPDATTSVKGLVKIAGDMGGTADALTVIGGTNHTHTASQVSDSTTVGRSVLIAADAAAARTAIGAGTSNLAIGTTSTTAKAGNYQPTSANISDAASIATVGTVIIRDSAGRAQVVDPSVAADIATKNYVDTVNTTRALASRLISSGTGLTGGGDLTADRTLAVSYGTASGTATQGNDTRVVNAVQTSDARVTADQAAATASIRTIGTGALQAAAGNHTHTVTGISDSTTVGRAVMTATDAAAARTAIGAGTSSLAIGTTSTTAKAGDYQPTAANISDSTTVGRAVLTAATTAAARTATGAAPDLSLTATKTTAYTVAANEIAVMNVSGGATALTLPTAPANNTLVGFLALGATTGTPLTISRGGTDTIGSASATSVTEPLSEVTRVFRYDAPNTRWLATSDVKPLSALDARFAAAVHTHTASQISDSTTVGRSLMTATDAAAARTATSAPLGNGITEIRLLTQATYDAIGTKSSSTLYVIQG